MTTSCFNHGDDGVMLSTPASVRPAPSRFVHFPVLPLSPTYSKKGAKHEEPHIFKLAINPARQSCEMNYDSH